MFLFKKYLFPNKMDKEIKEKSNKITEPTYTNEDIAIGMYMEQYQYKRKNTYEKFNQCKQMNNVFSMCIEMMKSCKDNILQISGSQLKMLTYDDIVDHLVSYNNDIKSFMLKQQEILDTPLPDNILDKYLKLKLDHKQL